MVVKQNSKQKISKKRKISSIDILPSKNKENYLNDANSDVELAYDAFINARDELSDAVKEQEDQGKYASKNAEQRYRAYRLLVEQAFNEREETEGKALEAYRESIYKSGKIYRDTLEAALEKCKSLTDNAWEASLISLKAPPYGEFIPAAGVWPKTKGGLQSLAVRSGNYLKKAFRNTKNFTKNRLNQIKTTNAQSCRLKLK